MQYFAEHFPDPVPPKQVSLVGPDAPVPPIPEEIPPTTTLPPAIDPTPVEAPTTEATPSATIELLVGLSATVNNLHMFIAEESTEM